MEFIDYYEIMGVEPDASAEKIKRKYRKLARKYHPDVSKLDDAEARFKQIGEAYAALKNPERRAEYDALRTLHAQGARSSAGQAGGGFRPPPGWQSGSSRQPGGEHWSSNETDDFSDFFREVFAEQARSGGHSRGSSKGQDIHSAITISLQAAYDGKKLPLHLRQPVQQANGSVILEDKTLQVTVPVGVRSGQRIRLRGQGAPGVGNAAAGDLYIEISIEDDPRFTVDGHNVTLVLPVTPWEAALGAAVSVETLGGKVRLNIPARSNGGTRLRLKGRGLPANPAGDQFVVLRVDLPHADTDEQTAVYESMRQLWPEHKPRTTMGERA